MGFKLKSALNLVGRAAGAAAGAYFGGPAGAMAGYSGADSVLGVVGLGSDQLANDETIKAQKDLAAYKYGLDVNMWNLQNAYNDPAAQMQRLKAAGLNPNLVYGSGNVTGNTSGSAPSFEYPSVNRRDSSLERKQLALALEEHHQRITNQAIENDLARQRLVLAEREADRSDALAQAQINAYKASYGMTDANIGNISFQQEQKRKDFAYKQYKADLDAWQNRYNQNYNKYAARLNEAKEIRRVMAIVGRRPMLMDYLQN